MPITFRVFAAPNDENDLPSLYGEWQAEGWPGLRARLKAEWFMLWRIRIGCRLERAVERTVRAVVWRLPRKVIYWAGIRLLAHATQGRFSNTVVPDLSAMEALQRWDVR